MFGHWGSEWRQRAGWIALAVACGLLIASPAGYPAMASDPATGETGVLARAKAAVCRYNIALVENALQIFLIQEGKPPLRLEDLYRKSFTRPPRCPAGGTFWLGTDGRVFCSAHDRPSPRSLRTHAGIGVERAE